MFKYLVIMNLLVMAVITQDMPPPDLEIPTEAPTTMPKTTTTTPKPITTTPEAEAEAEATTTTLTTEAFTTTTQNAITTTEPITTTAQEAITTSTTEEVSEGATTTTEAVTPTPTTTTIAPSSTMRNDLQPALPTTDSPFSATTTSDIEYPFYSTYLNNYKPKCYFKQQYGYPQVRWSCHGLKYVYPVECFKCCFYGFSNFAGCYRVEGHYCKSVNHPSGFSK